MAIRKPNLSVPNTDINNHIQWHSLKCQLVTHMYGGGVVSTVVDTDMPIRVTGIRGQLRFWWRLLAKQKWFKDLPATEERTCLQQIQQKEAELWGGMTNGDDDGKASLVLLRVQGVPSKNIIQSNLKSYEDYSSLKYVLFPAYNETDESLKPHKLLNSSDKIKWTLEFTFANKTTQEQEAQVIETLQWWANFGGLGFRTRKGLGSVQVTQSNDFPQIAENITEDEIKSCGCQLIQKNGINDPIKALGTAIQKLADFRQKPNVGRNEGQQHNRPGRSRWSEPDAIRRITNTHASLHKPEHKAGNVFPRGAFGLPILFHFVGRSEPRDIMLQPEHGERLASPLILRAVYCNQSKQWQPSALLLPHEHILDMQVTVNNDNYPIWQADKAQNIIPIKDNLPDGDVNPLTAFLTYFAK